MRLEDTPFARGGGGQIFKGRYMANAVAAKEVFQAKGNNHGPHSDFIAECRVLGTLAHPNVLQLYGVARSPRGELFMIFDLCTGGDLQAYLCHPRLRDPAEFARVSLELLSGVCYLHEKKIGHRDLKPANVLLASASPGAKLKITDFGLAKPNSTQVTRGLGTPGYMAPELFDDSENPVGGRERGLGPFDLFGVAPALRLFFFFASRMLPLKALN